MKRPFIALAVAFALATGSLGFLPGPASASHSAYGYDQTINRADLHQGHADVLRLYWAFFDRQPDAAGADYWVWNYNTCDWGSNRIAQFFSVSPEFVATYGSPTDEEFVDLIYANVFNRTPDAVGRTFWLDRLAGGQTRGSVVADLSFSPEFRTAHPLPSDGRPNTGCESADPNVYDPVSLLVEFSAAWDNSDWAGMAALATEDVIDAARDWQETTGVTSGITVEEARELLATECGHPGSGETSCAVGVAPNSGGSGLLFDITMLDYGNVPVEGSVGIKVIYLGFLGDAG